jgi:hypothetical protein
VRVFTKQELKRWRDVYDPRYAWHWHVRVEAAKACLGLLPPDLSNASFGIYERGWQVVLDFTLPEGAPPDRDTDLLAEARSRLQKALGPEIEVASQMAVYTAGLELDEGQPRSFGVFSESYRSDPYWRDWNSGKAVDPVRVPRPRPAREHPKRRVEWPPYREEFLVAMAIGGALGFLPQFHTLAYGVEVLEDALILRFQLSELDENDQEDIGEAVTYTELALSLSGVMGSRLDTVTEIRDEPLIHPNDGVWWSYLRRDPSTGPTTPK